MTNKTDQTSFEDGNSDQSAQPTDQTTNPLLAGIKKRIEVARGRLIDRNLRNRLISAPLSSTKAKAIRFFGESSQQVMEVLKAEKASMTFLPAPEQEVVPNALPAPDEENSGVELAYSVQLPDDDQRQSDRALQTKLTNSSLSKKLLSIYYESREFEEEQGVNVLYLACGFLKWYESENSEIARYAPLILLPVELVRQTEKGSGFKLRARDDEMITNVSLKVWLLEQFGIALPEIPEEDSFSPTDYFHQVSEVVSRQKAWEVLSDEILLGFFSFSKFLLWRDLDPANWPAGSGLIDHPIVQKLLSKATERSEMDPPLFGDPETEKLDDYFSPRDLKYVLDADSSQAEAIQTALAGRDLVIQGPPGTGKSQTITNLIAAAVEANKSVLFVAEKMAALEVVHQRLVKTGISEICFELHSRKANKKAAHAQIKDALDLPNQPTPNLNPLDTLAEKQLLLNEHAKRVNTEISPWGFTPFEIIGKILNLHSQGFSPLPEVLPKAGEYTKGALEEFKSSLADLKDRLLSSGFPAKNPWACGSFPVLTPFEVERLQAELALATELALKIKEKLQVLQATLPVFRDWAESQHIDSIKQLKNLAVIAENFRNLPPVSAKNLATFAHKDTVKLLHATLKEIDEHEAYIEKTVHPIWERQDIEVLRFRYVSNGGSIFSVFKSIYRQASGEITALLKDQSIKSFKQRVGVLDQLVSLSAARRGFESLQAEAINIFSEAWEGKNTDKESLATLSDWHDACGGLSQEEYQVATSLLFENAGVAQVSELYEQSEKLKQTITHIYKTLKADEQKICDATFSQIKDVIDQFAANLDGVNFWPPTRDSLKELTPQLGEHLAKLIWEGEIAIEHITPKVEATVFNELWSKISPKLPQLTNLDAQTLNATLKQFRELDTQRSKIAAAEIIHSYCQSRPGGRAGEMAIIRQELVKKSRHLSLRKLMNTAGSAIQKIKPVFLMSPLSVAQYLEPGKLMFDLVIIDEASQIRPEDALGAIARGKQIVVVGDQQQLPPTNFFNRITDDLDEEDESEELQISDMESILSLCDIALPNQCMLNWHYRSLHPGLIAVSNRNFYGDSLKLPPSTIRQNYHEGMGVSLIRSPENSYERGGSLGGTNTAEAKMIAQEVIKFAQQNPEKSLGVAAFSVKQRDLIRELVELEFTKNPSVKEFFSETQREPFFVKNLESIQGDERDAIFISVGYGRTPDGVLYKSFGPLASTGGERRLNVLISRAKERITVFSSITADDFKAEPGKLGLNAFREFLQYAEKGYFDLPSETGRTFDSDFEESVANFLISNGYKVQPQVGMKGFFIDLGVVHPENENIFLCGIECDGATYHSSRSARDRDRLRQQILESRGWRIFRIWSTDWFYRRAKQEKELLDALQQMLMGKQDVSPVFSTELSSSKEQQRYDLDVAEPSINEPPPEEKIQGSSDGELKKPVVDYVEYDVITPTHENVHEMEHQRLKRVILQILEIESPIHETEVARRLAASFGKEKAGNRIQSVCKMLLLKIPQAECQKSFWSIKGRAIPVRNRANVSAKSLQQAALIPPQEIIAAARLIIKDSVKISTADLEVQICRTFGFNRSGGALTSAVRDALRKENGHSIKTTDDDFWVAC